jgi:hypothetical protein
VRSPLDPVMMPELVERQLAIHAHRTGIEPLDTQRRTLAALCAAAGSVTLRILEIQMIADSVQVRVEITGSSGHSARLILAPSGRAYAAPESQ